MPCSVRTGPRSAATNFTSRAGQALQHFVGADRVERGEPVEDEMAMSMVSLFGLSAGPRRAEAVSVFGGAGADTAGERAPHRLGRAEAGGARDIRSTASVGRLEQAARDFDAHALDVRGGRAADLVAEHAGEVARAHRDARREPLDAVIVVGVLGDPLLELAQRIARRELRRRAAR